MVLQGFGVGPSTVGVVILVILSKLLQQAAPYVNAPLVSETDRQQASPLHRQSSMQTQTDWQIAEPQITWGRQQKGILNQHVRLQPRTYAQNCICRIVRSNAAIIQIQMASAYMESVAPSGLYLLLFLLLVVKCHHGFLSFSIYRLQDTKALVICT